jgi:cytochrome d ubiquinol oxidase subunit I
MILLAFIGGFYWWRGTLFERRWYLRVVSQCWWFGFIAVIAGWVVTETGRQPWVVYGQLRTADAVSPVAANAVLTTFVLFIVAYAIVFWFGIYYINRLIARGPDPGTTGESEYFSNNPLSGAHDRRTVEQKLT